MNHDGTESAAKELRESPVVIRLVNDGAYTECLEAPDEEVYAIALCMAFNNAEPRFSVTNAGWMRERIAEADRTYTRVLHDRKMGIR